MADFDLAEPLGAAAKAIFDDDRLWITFTDEHKDLGGPREARRLAVLVAVAVAGPIIARQVREKVAREIEARDHAGYYAVLWRNALAEAAAIARGGKEAGDG